MLIVHGPHNVELLSLDRKVSCLVEHTPDGFWAHAFTRSCGETYGHDNGRTFPTMSDALAYAADAVGMEVSR